MENVYLQEAFKALDILNEEDFNLGGIDSFKDAKEFLDSEDDEISFEDVIDPEAETEEELKDSYVGDVILDCCVCHSKLYKKPEDVVIDEVEGVANVTEECPFCYSTDGYTIIGEVAPYGEKESEEIEVEPEEEIEVEETEEVEDKEEIEESFKRNRKNESFRRRKKIKEHFEKVEIETDKDRMEMTSDENGKVVVTTEPKEGEEEVIVPVSDEIQSEINPISDEEDEDSYEDIDVTEFSEEDFDELGESYLKKVYENVNSFKTNKAKISHGKLVVEGIIGFNSGKQKKTSFVFESKDINKKGKVRFIGENLQFSRGKKSFTLTGTINEGKFIAESLNYNYRAKNSDGTSSRCYGTVKK